MHAVNKIKTKICENYAYDIENACLKTYKLIRNKIL